MAILYTAARDADQNRYEGLVLAKVVDRDYRIMSDVWGTADYARVWDEATASPKMILVNVYDMNPDSWYPVAIEVDASEEIKAKYLNWQINLEYQRLLAAEESYNNELQKGVIAKVVKGRNAKDTIGKVVVIMDASYGMGWRASVEKKLAIATSDVKVKKALRNGKVADVYRDVVWVWARNCQRVDVPQVDKDAVLQRAKERVVRSNAA
jgi:hypothetical protein